MKLNNEEYERILLGHIIKGDDVFEDYVIFDDLFTSKKHKDIFAAVKELKEAGYDVDILSVTDKSREDPAYISDLPWYTANTKYYYDKLLELYKKREIIKVGTGIINDIEMDYNELAVRSEKQLSEIDVECGKAYYVKDIVPFVIDDIEQIYHGTKDYGIKPNTPPLDYIVPGFKGSKLYILAARTSVGKSAYMTQLAINISKRFKCGIISLEMTKEEITQRIISNLSRINLNEIRKASKNAFDNITDACDMLQSMELIIDDTPSLSLNELHVKLRKMKKDGCKMIFIDYLHLISNNNDKLSFVQQLGEIMKALKRLTRSLDIPIMCLSQLNRSAEDKRPTLADLRWCGDIEQDADVVIFLHGDREDDRQELIVAKQRNGPIGSYDHRFAKDHQRFYEYTNLT